MLGTTIRGRYKIIKSLGRVGVCETYLAEDKYFADKLQCVVKQLNHNHNSAVLQIVRRLFDTEAKIFYKLGNHNQVQRLLAHFESNDEFYLVQEFIAGEDLTSEITPERRWSEADAVTFLEDVLEILKFVHQQNVVHRDINPQNLIRRYNDRKLVLINFSPFKGIVNLIANAYKFGSKTTTIGTDDYMGNSLQGGKPRFTRDIHAVGMIAIQGVTGLTPDKLELDDGSWREQAQVTSSLTTILEKMVSSHFRSRYQDVGEVLFDLRKLKKAQASSAAVFFKRGKQLRRLEKYPEALAYYDKGIHLNSYNFRAWFYKGNLLRKLQRNTEAIAAYDKAIQLKPDYPDSWNNRGIALWNLSRHDEAIDCFDRAIRLKSDYVEALYNKGYALRKLSRYSEAIPYYNRAIELKPDYAVAWNNLGMVLEKLQQYEEALAAYEKAAEFGPDYQAALENLKRLRERWQRLNL